MITLLDRRIFGAMSISRQLLVVALIAMTQSSHRSHCLPITSKPLAANPDHLPWDTMHASAIYHTDGQQEARKIAKSIFIAPSISYSTCEPGYTLNVRDKKCYKVDFQLDQQSLLIQQALGAFQTAASDKLQTDVSTDTGSLEYDYDDDSSSAIAAPYNVPLTLGFSSDLTAAASTSATAGATKLTDALQSSPFLNNGVGVYPTNSQTRRTTDNLPTTRPMDQPTAVPPTVAPTSSAVASDSNVAADGFQSLAFSPAVESVTRAMDSSTTRSSALTKATEETTTEMVSATTEDIFFNTIPTTTNDEQDHRNTDLINKQNRLAVAQLAEQKNGVALIDRSEDDELTKALKQESMFRDESDPEITTSALSTTLEPTEVPVTDVPISMSTQPFDTNSSSAPPLKTTSTTEGTINQATTTTVTAETTTAAMESVIAATELLNKQSGIETEVTKRQRQTVLKHELNEDARDSIDQHNRFVYAHLETSPTEPVTTTTTTTTEAPARPVAPTATGQSLRDRLNRFHRLSEENRKRLKATHKHHTNAPASDLFANNRRTASSSSVRFADNQRIADRSKPLFTWLPPGWKLDLNSGRPNIKAKPGISFWNEMPLIRDPALHVGVESTDRAARANSRSPTEHLFQQETADVEHQQEAEDEDMMGEDMPSPEVHKMVLATRNARYQNR